MSVIVTERLELVPVTLFLTTLLGLTSYYAARSQILDDVCNKALRKRSRTYWRFCTSNPSPSRRKTVPHEIVRVPRARKLYLPHICQQPSPKS